MRPTVIRSLMLVVAAVIFAATDAQAQWARQADPAGQIRFRLGLFEPAGSSAGWDDVFEGFTGGPSDLQDLVWGTELLWRPGRFGGIMLGFSSYAGSTTVAYRDWQADDGREIRHGKRLELSDISVAFVHRFGDGAVRPYAGVGGGVLWWELSEGGSFIDFNDPELPVFQAGYRAEGTTFEALGLIGIDVPLSPFWSFFAEGRYRWADDDLADDYPPEFGSLDLSGWELSGGFAIGF